MKEHKLSKGYSSRGADMGRRDICPDDVDLPIKLRMKRLKWVEFFVRAFNRNDAKNQIKDKLTNARFFR